MTANFYAGIDTALLGEAISVKVTETGGGGAVQTVTLNGRYFLTHELSAVYAGFDWLALSTELAAALVASPLNGTYVTAFNQVTGLFTISSSGGGVTAFQMEFLNQTTKNVLGFTATVSGALSYLAPVRSYYQIIATEGCVSEWSELREVDNELQTDLIAYDGTWVEGYTRPGAIKDWTLEVPWEPRAAVWADSAAAAVPWTWEHWFPHVRTGVPFIVEAPGLFPLLREAMGCIPSSKRAGFRPKLLGGDYLGHASIPLGGYYIGPAAL